MLVVRPSATPPVGGAVLGVAVGAAIAVAVAIAVAPGAAVVSRARPLRVATFNIEEFPRDRAQIDAALDELAGLRADAVAVQEILDPDVLATEGRRRLGDTWRFVHADTMPDGSRREVHVGVLYDGARWALASRAVHDETRLDGRQKPVLEVRLAPRGGGPVVQLFVVHLKAGGDGRDLRARQYEALARVVERARRPGERTVVLGDFNATADADRDDLALLAARTGLRWTTEALPCSAFWRRDDGCATSRLDHVLAWGAATAVVAEGACRDGCELRDRCPAYRDEVSDHCPVVATW